MATLACCHVPVDDVFISRSHAAKNVLTRRDEEVDCCLTRKNTEQMTCYRVAVEEVDSCLTRKNTTKRDVLTRLY